MIHRNFLQMFLLFSAGYILCYLLLWFDGRKESHLKTVKHNIQLIADDSVKPPIANLSLIQEETSVADVLANSIRILCLVITTDRFKTTRSQGVKNTWGKRCTKLIFISDTENAEFGSIKVTEDNGRDYVWGKVREGFKYAFRNYFNDFDWLLRVDDDSYVVMENLRYALSGFSPEQPLVFGRRFKDSEFSSYMHAGSGYALSRKALEKFFTESLRTPNICNYQTDVGNDDQEMSRCLFGVGVSIAESRDEEGRHRLYPFSMGCHLLNDFSKFYRWIWETDYYTFQYGPGSMSDTGAIFHHTMAHEMHFYEYAIYHLRPYGIFSNSYDVDELKSILEENHYKTPVNNLEKALHAIPYPPLSKNDSVDFDVNNKSLIEFFRNMKP